MNFGNLRAVHRRVALLFVLGVSGLALAADVPEVGSKAPAFELTAVTKGGKKETVKLSDYQGKKNVVLAFYPKAMTPGCTTECKALSKETAKFAELNTVVFGISTDTDGDQDKFIAKESLEIPLLADPDKKLTDALGALSNKGRANRYTYVIDKQGNIAKVFTMVKPQTHTEEVVKFLETLK